MRILIVGGGIAGVCLSRQLHQLNVDVTLIDSGVNHSTRVAAGMINPMTFRKMVKTWEGDVLLPYLVHFYAELERDTGQRFFFQRSIRRVFSTLHERVLWQERLKDPAYEMYIEPLANDTPSGVSENFGSGVVASPGYVDSPLFLKAAHEWLQKHVKLIYEEFDFNACNPEESRYQNVVYDWIIFAEGYRGKENPYFGYLPLQQTKGEVLTVNIEGLNQTEIINRKCFILPTQDGKAKLGATFAWNTTDVSPTDAGREELLQQYSELILLPVEILAQEAGIRPTVTDRRPLLGVHPKHNRLAIFNGLGTKGYMLAPYFSEVFVNRLLHHHELPAEVDIKRFQKFYDKA